MDENQAEIGELYGITKSDSDDDNNQDKRDINNYVFAESIEQLEQNEIVYKCVFHLEADMLNYYYTPGPNVHSQGVPLLYGSPEFDGAWDTKWQISVNLNRWVGMHRWMSIYLTRVDKLLFELSVECNFKILDKDGKVVFSQRNNLITSGKINKDTSMGFRQFLPFSDVLKNLIDGDKLSIEAHLFIFNHATTVKNLQVDAPVTCSQNSNCTDDCFYYDPESVDEDSLVDYTSNNTIYNADIPEADRIEIQLNGKTVAFARRDNLKKNSPIYKQCVETNDWDCTSVVNLKSFSRESLKKQLQAIRGFVDFVHEEPCAILVNGSYKDVQVLLQLALKWNTNELICQCIALMTQKVDFSNAADHAIVIRAFSQFVNPDDFRSFNDYFKSNFRSIRKSKRFKELKNTFAAEFAEFIFLPCDAFRPPDVEED